MVQDNKEIIMIWIHITDKTMDFSKIDILVTIMIHIFAKISLNLFHLHILGNMWPLKLVCHHKIQWLAQHNIQG